MAEGCAVVDLHCPVRVVQPRLPIPLQYSSVLQSCHALFVARCVVCGVCLSVVFVWWGILCALPPRSGGGVAIVDGGVALCGGVAW